MPPGAMGETNILETKRALVAKLREHLDKELASLLVSQRESQAAATHEEAKPEGDKDMRATESSYLARGLAQRVADLSAAVATLDTLNVREFSPKSTVALTALVTVGDENAARETYFLCTAAGGHCVEHNGTTVRAITPQSPIGQALLGKCTGEEVELTTPQGPRELVILLVQ